MSTSTFIFEEFNRDPVYSPYMSGEFDVQQHTTELVQGVVIADHLTKLSLGLSRVESSLEQHVGEHYEELLAQAAGIDTLEHSLAAIQSRTQTLQAGVERVRVRINEPCQQLRQRTLVLARLQATCEMLRRLQRCLALTQRLQKQLQAGEKELAKAATSVRELEELHSDGDLDGVAVVEGSEQLAREGRAGVEARAREMLTSGAASHNQTQVGAGLQVFHNLGSLGSSVQGAVLGLLSALTTTVASTLDPVQLADAASAGDKRGTTLGKTALPGLGQTTQFRAALWASMEKLMDAVYSTMLQTQQIYKVLGKKRDPVSHVPLLGIVLTECGGGDVFAGLWTDVTAALGEHFSRAAHESHLIRQALEVDYPKLVRLYGDLWRRLEGGAGDVIRAGGDERADPQELLRASLQPLEAAFLSRSLSRLSDPVNLMFSPGPLVPPTRQECDALVRTISSEVNVSSVDAALGEAVSRNVLTAVRLLCSKCEGALPAGEEAVQVIGPATPQQQQVAGTVNQLYHLRGQLERTLSASLSHLTLSNAALATLKECLPALDAAMVAAVAPLFSAITASVEDILHTMHQEDFSDSTASTAAPSPPCSLYLRELQSFLSRAATDYVAPYTPSPVIRESVEGVGRRCLRLFVWHASLLRPVGEAGKLRLAADFAQLEEGISALCPRPSDLGDSYRMVRAVRPLLFLTPQHMVQVSTVGTLIPHSIVLHLLFARAPPELKSPHQSAGWSIPQYLAWLDDHPGERERLQLVSGCLESYAASVKRAGRSHYASVYPVMMEALQRGQGGGKS